MARSFIGSRRGADTSTELGGLFGAPLDPRLRSILLAGMVLRVIVFVALEPYNNDDHAGVIRYTLDHWSIPVSNVLQQSYHPPLYYAIVLPFAAVGRQKITQLASLVLSLLNLLLMARMIATTSLFGSTSARRHAMALASFLPQFVIFGLFISNDTLAFLVGTLAFSETLSFIDYPAPETLATFAGSIGIGLLTKGTFLAFVPVAAAVVLLVGLRQRWSARRHVANAAIFSAILLLLGGYKFAQNYRELGRPIVHNMERLTPDQLRRQQTLTGVESFVRLDVARLAVQPLDQPVTRHSIPMLLYATTWYPYLRESNFVRTRRWPWSLALTLLCLAGLLPTALGVAGGAMLVPPLWRAFRRGMAHGVDPHLLKRAAAAAFLASTVGIVIAAGLRFDAFSCFQGRLLFPAAFGALVLIGCGYDAAVRRMPAARRTLNFALAGASFAALLFFVIEVPGALGALGQPRPPAASLVSARQQSTG